MKFRFDMDGVPFRREDGEMFLDKGEIHGMDLCPEDEGVVLALTDEAERGRIGCVATGRHFRVERVM